MMHVIALDDYQDALRKLDCFARLGEHRVTVLRDTEKDPVKLAERLRDADAVILTQQRSSFPRAVVERLPRLQLISQTGRNTAHIDVAACTEHGVVVAAAGSGSPHATAELTWGLILASVRHIPHEVKALKEGVWQTTVGTGLHGKILGVYAFGRIGRLVAEVGRAFGMRVVCWGREGSLAKARGAGFAVAASREAFFASADVISLHVALNDETRGLVTAADLAGMKASALIVNTSRAQLIGEGALVAALRRGRPGRAAIDVFEDEPVSGGAHPLLAMPNVVCTPHLGYVEEQALERLYGGAIDSILGFAAGVPVNVLNPEAIGRRRSPPS
jgi:D-3-phosphoglycerate dehydrogenase